MLNIMLSENVINNIDNFINWYRKIFLEKFIDTWIFNNIWNYKIFLIYRDFENVRFFINFKYLIN